ncbi:hypothetical protein [Nostoc sp.]|uniref:hypothetical protein n=1 Tax=Nostoc sp. TaxID=1180 RepID=UPI002FF4A6F0
MRQEEENIFFALCQTGLTQSEIQLIFSHGLENDRDRQLKYDICSNLCEVETLSASYDLLRQI